MALNELQGFILTRRSRDAPDGIELEYWLATEQGPRKLLVSAQTAVAFFPARHRAAVEAQLPLLPGMELRELELKTFGQEPVIGVYARQSRQLGKLARALAPQGVDAEQLVTVLSFELNPDGSLKGRPRVVSQSGVTDSNRPQQQLHAERAIRAVQLAAPFDLPDEFYDKWKRVSQLRFDRRL